MKRFLASAVVAAAFCAAPALAADMPTKGPIYKAAAPFDWTGFYLGGDAGYLWSGSTYFIPGAPGFTAHPDPNSFTFDGHIGYRYQLSNGLVLGLEGDFGWLNGKNADFLSNSGAPGGSGFLKLSRDASLRGIAGWAMDRDLYYVTGGAAWMHLFGCDTSNPASTICPSSTVAFGGYQDGWTIGVGLAHAFTENFIGRIEYLYADYGNKSYSTPGVVGGVTQLDLHTSTVRAGLSWKFDGLGKLPVSAKY
jgi:outer membrane immunogenic protein